MHAIFCSHNDCFRYFGYHTNKKTLLEVWAMTRKPLHWTITNDGKPLCAAHGQDNGCDPEEPQQLEVSPP